MRHAAWPPASLFLLTCAAQAAQGIHPGPLPTPIGPDGGVPQPRDLGYPGAEGWGSELGRGPVGDPRAATDYRQGRDSAQGRPGPSYAPAGQDPGFGDRGYPPPPPPPAGSPTPRGYWQWVPAEPGEADALHYRALPSRGGSGEAYGYPMQGYAAPAYDGYGDTLPGHYSPPSFGSYPDRYPAHGSAARTPPDTRTPFSGHYPEPPGAAAARRTPAAADAPSSPPARP
jgi:hypothetical protein